MSHFRKVNYVEQKLIKKTNFYQWESDGSENWRKYILATLKKYHLKDQDEFFFYNKMIVNINRTIKVLQEQKKKKPELKEFCENQLLLLAKKLFNMGIIDHETELEKPMFKATIDDVCRRRITYVLFQKKFAETVAKGHDYVEQGHIKIGPEIVTNPTFIVTKNLEHFIDWTYGSKIKKNIDSFNGVKDDFE